MGEVAPQRFREVMGHFATGVAVVTCTGPEGPAGLTTNAVCSLSLDPLLLLVCFDNGSRTLPAIRASGRFAVNVLAQGGEELARTFASKALLGHEKFEAVTHTVDHGVPVLDDALAWVVCDLRELLPGGDHTVGIGAVHQLGTGPDPDARPLLWFQGAYAELGA